MTEFHLEPATLKRPPRYGCFLWWPEPGSGWIDEDDRFIAEHLVPGQRVFECTDAEPAGWNFYRYGRIGFRGRAVMWTEVSRPAFELGDFVEVRSQMGRGRPLSAVIRELFWSRSDRRFEYQLAIAGRRLTRLYADYEMELSARIGDFVPRTRRLGKLRDGGYAFERDPDVVALAGPEIELKGE